MAEKYNSQQLNYHYYALPLPSSSSQDNATSERVCDVPVRIINPVKKKDYQVFTLRCVKKEITHTPEGLRKVLLSHFGKELIPDATNFDIGWQQKLWIRS